MAIGPHPKNEDITEQHLMFGTVKVNGEWRPVLQRQATGGDACTACRGYGHGGNPLCGAVYTCEECDGSGLRQPGQPPYKAKEDVEVEVDCRTWSWLPLLMAATLVAAALVVRYLLIQQ